MPTIGRLARVALFSLATSTTFERVVRAAPLGEKAAWRLARRYVAGQDVDAAVALGERLAVEGVGVSVDLFGEQVGRADVAERAVTAYVELARRISTLPSPVWLAVDLSHVGLDVSPEVCRANLERVAAVLPPGRMLQVGAEDSGRAEAVLSIVLATAAQGTPVMATLQANLRRSAADLSRLMDAGVPVRLVKGAYVEPASEALPWGEPTDMAYVRLAGQLHRSGVPFALATHDRRLRESLLCAFGPTPCEVLLGIRNEDVPALTAGGCPVRVYLPCGQHWFRYAMRRIAEACGA